MRLIILSSSPEGRVARRFLSTASELGIDDVQAVSIDRASELLKEDLSETVILPRIAPEENEKAQVLQQLEDAGAYVVNSPQSWIDSRDKWRSYELFSQYNIATPATISAPVGTYDDSSILGDRVIFKPLNGTHGNGIVFINKGDELPKDAGVLQAFIPEAANTDVRLFVVNDEVVASMMRKARGRFPRESPSRCLSGYLRALRPNESACRGC